jgi:hypothetical protein
MDTESDVLFRENKVLVCFVTFAVRLLMPLAGAGTAVFIGVEVITPMLMNILRHRNRIDSV